jgi:hypothetical protein
MIGIDLRLRNTSVGYAPRFIEDGQVLGLLPAHGEFAIANVVDVRGSIVSWLSAACELVSRKHNGVVVVGQHVLNLLSETAASHLHCLAGKLIQPFPPSPRPCNRASPWYVETEVFRARLEIAIHVTASKRSVSFSNYGFK